MLEQIVGVIYMKGYYHVNKEQMRAVEVINKLGCISKDQLIKMNIFKKTKNLTIEDKINIFNKLSYNRNAQQFKIIDDIYYVPVTAEKIDKDMLKCIQVMLTFPTQEIKWFAATEYPFKLSFSREKILDDGQVDIKTFDIAVLKKGEEIIFNKTLEKSFCERLILIVDKATAKQYKPIQIINREGELKRMLRYCTLNPVQYYNTLEEITE